MGLKGGLNLVASDLVPDITSLQNSINEKSMLCLQQKHGFWGEIVYKDSGEIIVKPKKSEYGSFIGKILNNGKFLEATSAITVKYDTTANSGHILNGLGKIASSIQNIIAFEDESGELAFGFSWQPKTTLKTALTEATAELELNQINSADIGKLFTVGAELVCFETATKFETPCFYQSGAWADNYNPVKDWAIETAEADKLTMSSEHNITDFDNGTGNDTTIYQVNNFQPLDISTGGLASVIGSRGWSDTGRRIIINSSSNIIPFMIINNVFYFVNGSESANYGSTQGYDYQAIASVNRLNYCPPDKVPVLTTPAEIYISSRAYWVQYYETMDCSFGAFTYSHSSKSRHGLVSIGSANNFSVRGYLI